MEHSNIAEGLPNGTRAFHVVYRISDKGYNARKLKLPNATKQHCLLNAIHHFGSENFHVIADNCSEEMISFIASQGLSYEVTHLGNSPSFKYAITKVVNTYQDHSADNDIVYMLEDDYLHLDGSMQLITEGLEIADYVTLYDHYDQYLTYKYRRIVEGHGAAPTNRFGFHRWRIFLTAHSHWRETPSTTMTFAARVKTLREDLNIFMRNPDQGVPDDFITFLRLTKHRSLLDAAKVVPILKASRTILMNNFAFFRKKRLLIASIPGRSTHCQSDWLSPLTDWSKI